MFLEEMVYYKSGTSKVQDEPILCSTRRQGNAQIVLGSQGSMAMHELSCTDGALIYFIPTFYLYLDIGLKNI